MSSRLWLYLLFCRISIVSRSTPHIFESDLLNLTKLCRSPQPVEVSGRLHDDQGPCSVHRCGVHQKGQEGSVGCHRVPLIPSCVITYYHVLSPFFPFDWSWRGILFLGKPIQLVNETWLAGKFQMKAKWVSSEKNGMQKLYDYSWPTVSTVWISHDNAMHPEIKGLATKSALDLEIHPTW